MNFVNRKNLDLGIGVFIIKKEDAFNANEKIFVNCTDYLNPSTTINNRMTIVGK